MYLNAGNLCNVRTCNKYYKIAVLVIFLLIFVNIAVFNSPRTAFAESLNESIENQLNELDFSSLEEFNQGNSASFLQTVKNILNGNFFDSQNFLTLIINAFFGNVYAYLPLLISLLAIVIFGGIMNGAKSNVLSEGANGTVRFVCYSAVIVITFTAVTGLTNVTVETIDKLTLFTDVLSPILLTLMTASGGTVSVGLYKPAVVLITSAFTVIIKSVIIPIVTLMVVINVVANLSSDIKLNKFSDLFASFIKWTLGIFCTVFATFLTVQGVASASMDGISLKTARYALSNGIPIIGGFIGSGLNVVILGASLIKSAVGVGGVVVLFYTVFSPIVKIVAFQLLIKLISAITEPMGNTEISNYMTGLSKCTVYLTVTLILCAFLLVVFIILLIISSGVAV